MKLEQCMYILHLHTNDTMPYCNQYFVTTVNPEYQMYDRVTWETKCIKTYYKIYYMHKQVNMMTTILPCSILFCVPVIFLSEPCSCSVCEWPCPWCVSLGQASWSWSFSSISSTCASASQQHTSLDQPQYNVSHNCHYTRQPTLLLQSFTMPLLMATSTFGLGRRCWSSPQQCLLLLPTCLYVHVAHIMNIKATIQEICSIYCPNCVEKKLWLHVEPS